ncbi:MarR family transcriptional regulator [Clostridium sp.]|uniref:MarR family winged helix-turn-helix transcriptional regulator n=1 Tax=Clostridium sp. TaxID=1506 RepID=UPI003216AA7E
MELELDNYIGFILNNVTRKFSQFTVNFFKEYNITPEQAGIIRRLGEEEGITQKDLAIRMAKDQTNVTRLLDQLERKGLVMRNRNKDDKRSFLAYLTDEGKELNEYIIPAEQEIMNIALRGISEEKKALLKEIISEITENLNLHSSLNANNEKEQ